MARDKTNVVIFPLMERIVSTLLTPTEPKEGKLVYFPVRTVVNPDREVQPPRDVEPS